MQSLFTSIKSVLGCFVLGIALVGCSVLDSVAGNEASARVVVGIATLAAIEQSGDRTLTARRVIQAAEDAQAWLDFEGVTIEELAAKARERIATSDLELSGKAALSTLVDILEAEVEDGVSAGTLGAEARVTVNRMLDWVIASAQAYAG